MATPIELKYKRRCREYLDKVVPHWDISTSAINDSGLAYTADIDPPLENVECVQAATIEAFAERIAELRKETIP